MGLRIGNTIIPAVRFISSSGSARYQTKIIDPTAAMQNITADTGYDALSQVTINAIQTETQTINNNGTYTPSAGKYFTSVTVNVPTNSGTTIINQNKTINPTESIQTISADSGYTGLGTVTVNAISPAYIGSEIIRRSSSDLTASGSTITVPSGYYSSNETKSVANGSAGTPTATKGVVSNHSMSITPSVTNITGYIEGSTKTGTAVTVSASELVSGNKAISANGTDIDVTDYATVSVDVPSSGVTINNQNKTVTPTESSQTIAADSGYTGLGTVTVNRIPTNYIIPSGTKSITENGNGIDVTSYASVDVDVSGGDNSLIVTLDYNQSTDMWTPDKTFVEIRSAGLAHKNIAVRTLDGAVTADGYWDDSYSCNEFHIQLYNSLDDPITYQYYKYTNNGLVLDYEEEVVGKYFESPSVTYTPTTSTQTDVITYDPDYYTGIQQVNVTVNAIPSQYIIPSGNKSITQNGNNIDVVDYATVTVNVPTDSTINNQNKTVTPSTSQQSITADSGYTGLGTVTVDAMPTMTLPMTASSTASSGTNKATIDRSTSVQYINIPTGYNSTASYYTISATPNGSVTSPGSISGTTATVSTGSNTLTLTKTISVTPNVTTAGYISEGTAGNTEISLTASVTTKAAATITPGTNNQTIAADTYLTGIQTISGDANLKAENIKSGVTIFGKTGTFSGLDTSDADAVAANVLYGKTAYVNGSKITGTMANNGATGSTITTQGGTYTIPAGYTSGGTVTASLTASTLTNSIINGSAYEEDTGDYAWRTTINIPAGYHNATTLTKDFSSIFPAPDTPATASQILLGYQVYDEDGKLITGTMANNTYSNTLNDTRTSITIPAGYHDGTGTVSHTTVNIPDPTISVNTSTGVITASGSWTKGYTTDSSYSNTYNLTTLGATTYNVSSSNQTITSGKYITGTQTIRAVTTSNITAANVKAGTIVQVGDSADSDRVLSVTGTFTSDATATAADIASGETAYVNGSKITGSLSFITYYTGTTTPSSSLGNNGDIYLKVVN